MSPANIRKKFKSHFNYDPEILVRSPGRVNLIGEHTDYNNGYVLPAAIDKNIVLALSRNTINEIRCYSVDKDEKFRIPLDAESFEKNPLGWPDYFMGVLQQLDKSGYTVQGFDCAFGGDLPIGAGLSSSAALEGGILFGLSRMNHLELDSLDMAKMGQRAENQFVGVNCGIMDQFANIFGRTQHVFKLDCRSLEYEYHPFKADDIYIVLCDTGVRRALASSEYNIRRTQCETGVNIVKKRWPGVSSLRDISLDQIEDMKSDMDTTVYNRCVYVVEENKRVESACADLEKGDMEKFGKRMYESHAGLRDKYEVSCKELDILVDAAAGCQGVLGSRMMGAGFGGCTINLVRDREFSSFSEQIQQVYKDKTGRDAKIYRMQIAGGTSLVQAHGKAVRSNREP